MLYNRGITATEVVRLLWYLAKAANREVGSVPKKRRKPARKKRTRAHIIADLSAHHVEGHILRCGFTAERVAHDYGVDVYMTTYTVRGEVENDFVLFQL